jgi:hypothetical protein
VQCTVPCGWKCVDDAGTGIAEQTNRHVVQRSWARSLVTLHGPLALIALVMKDGGARYQPRAMLYNAVALAESRLAKGTRPPCSALYIAA